MPRAQITALGHYLPDYVLTNAELEQLVDTTDAWIRERTGVAERRILTGERGASYMGVRAVQELLAKKGLAPTDIDLLICCTVTPDMVFPATANVITDELGATRAWGFDLGAACSGFLYGVCVASQFIETGRYGNVVVVGVDKMSSIIDYQDRNTCIIFGDGAGAVLLEPDTAGTGHGIQDFVLYSDGGGMKHLHMKSGGSRRPPNLDTVRNREHYVYQEGQAVFKRAVVGMAEAAAEIMERNNLTGADVDWLVPHQANLRIIEATANRMGLTSDKVMVNIERYGNTTSGTLPLCLSDWESQLKPGDRIVLARCGGGFPWGAVALTWASGQV